MDYLDNYRRTHQHPLNRALHTVGIPAVVASLPLAIWNWRWGASLFVFGWVLQFLGHWFEGKPPAFFSNPIYLLVGPYWWLKKLRGEKARPPKLRGK